MGIYIRSLGFTEGITIRSRRSNLIDFWMCKVQLSGANLGEVSGVSELNGDAGAVAIAGGEGPMRTASALVTSYTASSSS